MLGFDTDKSLVLSSGVLEMMDNALPGLWDHSLACARACTFIAEEADLEAPEEVSVIGLLHDLGKVILSQTLVWPGRSGAGRRRATLARSVCPGARRREAGRRRAGAFLRRSGSGRSRHRRGCPPVARPSGPGQSLGAILVLEDVTEKARLEGEVIRMERLATVGQMVITVNHEINNPLAIINTSAQAARLLNWDLDGKTVAKLQMIEAQVKRISEVTERLRTMEEVESNDYIADGPQMIDIHGKARDE